MGWDYIDDESQYQSNYIHYWASDRWQTIDVQLEAQDRVVSLTRKEWRQLQSFLAKHEFESIQREDYAHLPAKVITIIADWLRSRS